MSPSSSHAAVRRYALGAIVLHWTIAVLIVLQVVLSGRMDGRTPEAFAVTQLHKSVGITVLLLSLARLGWRLAHPPPPEPASLSAWERRLAKGVHWGFYVVMLGMPLTGWIMVSASRIAVPTLLYGVIPWPNVPGLEGLTAATKHAWHEVAEQSHGIIIKFGYALLALHVAGALKHQLFSRAEPILPRMAPGARTGRWAEPWLLAILVGFGAVVAFGRTVQPPLPATAPPPERTAAEAASAPEPAATVTPAPTPTPALPVATAAAAPPNPPKAPPPAPSAWRVLPGSTLGFATAWSGQAIEGRFDRWRADIRFSPEALKQSRVTVSVDLSSVNTGDEQRDASLPSEDWFDAADHPEATFTSTRFERTGEGRFVAHGRLSLRGVSRPLDLPFRLKITGDRAQVSGVTSLDRTAFGVGQGEWQSTDQIPARVSVKISLSAARA